MPSGAVLEGRGRPLQPKSAGLPGITRQRVGLPLKIFRLNSLLLLPPSPPGAPPAPDPTDSLSRGAARARVSSPHRVELHGYSGCSQRTPSWFLIKALCRQKQPLSQPLDAGYVIIVHDFENK